MNPNSISEIKDLLDVKVREFNCPEYIETDPIQIPHQFSKKENIEISAFLAATIAWGQRKSIIKNAFHLIQLMDNDPFDFIINAKDKDYAVFDNFKHRTFNGIDTAFFIKSLQNIYKNHGGLQRLFEKLYDENKNVKTVLAEFRKVFLSLPHEKRTEKHIANVDKKSAAKRLNMFLRWMVRKDNSNVDFGIWNLPMSELYIPLDVHCGNVARKLNLLHRKQNDWQAVEELTSVLRQFDPNDPVKYDFALFGLGVFEKF